MTERINLAELRERINRYEVNLSGFDDRWEAGTTLLDLIDAVEAAADYITVLNASGSATTDHLETALNRFDIGDTT